MASTARREGRTASRSAYGLVVTDDIECVATPVVRTPVVTAPGLRSTAATQVDGRAAPNLSQNSYLVDAVLGRLFTIQTIVAKPELTSGPLCHQRGNRSAWTNTPDTG